VDIGLDTDWPGTAVRRRRAEVAVRREPKGLSHPYAVSVSCDSLVASRRRGRTRAVVVGVVVVLVVVGAAGLDRWRHPTAFGGLGDGFVADPRPVAQAGLATTVIFPVTRGEDVETVALRDVSAVFSTNTAEATATFSVCHMSPGENPIGVVDEADDYCARVEPFTPGMELRRDETHTSDYLVVTVTPTRPGVAQLERVEVDYRRAARHFLQQGVESIRVSRRITAT
jgi:hypothetical protein